MASRIVIDESIEGYHHFKIRPPYITPIPQLPMDRECTNIKDVNACLVLLPSIDSFPSKVHEMFTDEKKSLKDQCLQDLVKKLENSKVKIFFVAWFQWVFQCINSYMKKYQCSKLNFYLVTTFLSWGGGYWVYIEIPMRLSPAPTFRAL